MRAFIGVLVVVLLAGCDGDEPTRETRSQPQQQAPAVSADPAPVPESPAPASTLEVPRQQDEPPAIEIESAAEPETPAEPKLTVKVSPPAPRKAPPAPSGESLPPPKLDLSLPEDWVETLEEGEPTESHLLPPLFAAPQEEPSVHVSGRLIPGVEDDETVIDGAQLDFEFKR